MLPSDLDLLHLMAVALIFICWFAYTPVFAAFTPDGSLNAQLEVVRRHWLSASTGRIQKPYDAILLGHIVHSIAFFGSATLLVLAAVLSTFVNLEAIHKTFGHLSGAGNFSLQLFALEVVLLAFILALCFSAFTYSLRKLVYSIALIGALPAKSENCETHDVLVASASIVLSEAIQTFNFGIRGFYYAIAMFCVLISPWVSIGATIVVTCVLIYRQLRTPTAAAIADYVKAAEALDK